MDPPLTLWNVAIFKFTSSYQFDKGGWAMITWQSDLSKALELAQAEKKTILLDFFNPG
jgi:hypothetical protein